MHFTQTTIIASIACLLTLFALPSAASENKSTGHADAGKTKSAICASCHGTDGNSVVPSFPKLAGQQPGYNTKQLQDFKSDERSDATMKGMVAALSEQDMLDLDAYYASIAPTTGQLNTEQQEDALKGEAIFRAGVAEFSVSPCMACHGPDGQGVQPMFPRLAGQHATYIEKQLLDFKSGARKDTMMSPIAFPLSSEQIKQLALYISVIE